MLTIADSQPEAATVANLCKYGDGDGDASIVLAFKESPREVAAYLLGPSAGGRPTELEELRSERNHLSSVVSPLKAEVKRLREQLRNSESERVGLREHIKKLGGLVDSQKDTIFRQEEELEKVDQILVAVGAEEMGPNRVGSIEWLASAWNSSEQEQKRLRVLTEGYKTTVEDHWATITRQRITIEGQKQHMAGYLSTIKSQKATIARLRNVIEDQKQHMVDPAGVQVGGPIDLEGGELLVWTNRVLVPDLAVAEMGYEAELAGVAYIIRDHRVVWRRPDAVEEG